MGIRVMSVNGMLVTRIRTYVLKCSACTKYVLLMVSILLECGDLMRGILVYLMNIHCPGSHMTAPASSARLAATMRCTRCAVVVIVVTLVMDGSQIQVKVDAEGNTKYIEPKHKRFNLRGTIVCRRNGTWHHHIITPSSTPCPHPKAAAPPTSSYARTSPSAHAHAQLARHVLLHHHCSDMANTHCRRAWTYSAATS